MIKYFRLKIKIGGIMYKLVISDLDGTLLNQNHELSSFTKETVGKLVKVGVKFFIATGRHHVDAVETKAQLGLEDAYLITSNGARVHDASGNLLISHNHKYSIAKEILELKLKEGIHINIFSENRWLIFEDNPFIDEWIEKATFKYTKGTINDVDFDNVIKWYYLGEHDKLVALKEYIDFRWGDEVEGLFSLPDCLEIMPKGISKGKAIEEVIAIENIDKNETMAFGDGFNDFEMLNFVHKGLIMENAHIKLKNALPNNEIIDSNENDGVAKYLKKVFNI